MITRLADHYQVTMKSFLSGAELLSNQTFRELFSTETIAAGEGLAVKRLALLFTDLQGSTALYERIGDMKAYELVRLHFGYLRERIARNSGALVKTIGDAVMASFVDPLDALRAALDMQARIKRFNADAGSDLIRLKVGLTLEQSAGNRLGPLPRRRMMKLAIWIAFGVGIGTAIGAAMNQTAMGVAFGAAFGTAVGTAFGGKRR